MSQWNEEVSSEAKQKMAVQISWHTTNKTSTKTEQKTGFK